MNRSIRINYFTSNQLNSVLGNFKIREFFEISNVEKISDLKNICTDINIQNLLTNEFIENLASFLKQEGVLLENIKFKPSITKNSVIFTIEINHNGGNEKLEIFIVIDSIDEIIDEIEKLVFECDHTNVLYNMEIAHYKSNRTPYIFVINNHTFRISVSHLDNNGLKNVSTRESELLDHKSLNIKILNKNETINEFLSNKLFFHELICIESYANVSLLTYLITTFKYNKGALIAHPKFQRWSSPSDDFFNGLIKTLENIYEGLMYQNEIARYNLVNYIKKIRLISEKDYEELFFRCPWLIEKDLLMLEQQLETEVGIIDLYAQDSNGKTVIIELKKGKSSDHAVGQIARYMGIIKETKNLAIDQLRGIIICQVANPKLKYAVSILPNVKIMEFNNSRILINQAKNYLQID